MSRPFKFEKQIDVMMPTTDCWFPNYENNMVKLSYIGRLPNKTFRVAVWGADDYGLKFDAEDKRTAKKIFNNLKEKVNITKGYLYELGFVNG